MRIILFFYKPLFLLNISLSVVLSLSDIHILPLTFATFGFLCSYGLIRLFEKNTVYMYHNLGYSRWQLFWTSGVINAFISLLFIPLRWI